MKTTLTIISLGIILIGCGKKKSPVAKQIPEAINQSQKQPEKPKGKPTAQPLTGEEAFEILKTGLSGITLDKSNKTFSIDVDALGPDYPSITFSSRVPPDFPTDKSVAGQNLRRIMFRVEGASVAARAKIAEIKKRMDKINDARNEIYVELRNLYRTPKPKTQTSEFIPLPAIPAWSAEDQNKTTQSSSRIPRGPSRRSGGGGLDPVPSRRPGGLGAVPTRGNPNSKNPPKPQEKTKQDPLVVKKRLRLNKRLQDISKERSSLMKEIEKFPRQLVMYQSPLHKLQAEAKEELDPKRWVLGPEIDISPFFLFWSDELGEWIDEWTETNSLPSRLKVELAFRRPDGRAAALSDILSCEVFSPDAAKSHLAKAKKGDAQAQYNLGMMYSNGNQVKKDFKEAAKWWRKSAEQGNAPSQAFLALSYFRGEGVPKDLITGYAWIHIAEINGVADDISGDDILIYEKVESLVKKMTSGQMNKAIRMATGMINKNPKLKK
jgi:hypothetical protein